MVYLLLGNQAEQLVSVKNIIPVKFKLYFSYRRLVLILNNGISQQLKQLTTKSNLKILSIHFNRNHNQRNIHLAKRKIHMAGTVEH